MGYVLHQVETRLVHGTSVGYVLHRVKAQLVQRTETLAKCKVEEIIHSLRVVPRRRWRIWPPINSLRLMFELAGGRCERE